jgi:ferric-dicitrate binding protein FerR (iron transport regulator)
MKILTRRNAMLGWATWKTAKGIAKYHKAKKALPNPTSKKPSKKKRAGKALAGVAAVAGVAALVKRKGRHGGGHHDAPDSSAPE